MMFVPKFPCEFEHVDAFIVFHAGKRFRAKSFLGKEIEPGSAHPIVHQGIRTRVSSKTRFQAFLENFGEFEDRKSTRLNSSHQIISYAVFCLKKKKKDM